VVRLSEILDPPVEGRGSPPVRAMLVVLVKADSTEAPLAELIEGIGEDCELRTGRDFVYTSRGCADDFRSKPTDLPGRAAEQISKW